MSVREKFYEIMEKEDPFESLVGEVKKMLEEEKINGNISSYTYEQDLDVYDSCGLDIYYLSIAWVNKDGSLEVAGASYWSY